MVSDFGLVFLFSYVIIYIKNIIYYKYYIFKII